MKHLHRLLAVAAAAFFIAGSALAQNAGTVTLNAFAVGLGPGVQGFKSVLCTGFAVGTGSGAAPTCRVIQSSDIPASVALTGAPTAPTAAVDTNTTQLATTAFVLGQAASVTPLIDGGAAVGTSTRYARADHIHPTDTTRSPVASPTFTGVPAAPTASQNTNTTQIATTQFVLGQASGLTPVVDGAATAGVSALYSRADHVHPFPAMTGDVTSVLGAVATTIAANAVTNAKMATMAAFTFKGNNTSGPATPTDVDISLLTAKASPVATDLVMISDQAASGAWKKVTISSLASAGSVASIAGNTGAFTLANGIDNSVNQIQLTAARRTLPTTQTLTSGTGATYTTPANVLWLEVWIVGGGGGGAGTNTTAASFVAGTVGTASSFNSVNANGGGGGPATQYAQALGGSAGTGTATRRINGEIGGPTLSSSVIGLPMGRGGNSAFAFGGAPGPLIAVTVGTAGTTNTGGGGGGAANNGGANANAGGGGAGGETAYLIINSPAATYTYTVGGGGAGGVSTTNGGAGGSGVIFVVEHYGS